MKGIIEMAEEEAKQEYEKYREVLKGRENESLEQYEEIKKAYRALSKGQKVIDIFEAFKKTGVNSDGEPKLAICRADYKTTTFEKENIGSGTFYGEAPNAKWNKENISLPSGTFEDWEHEKDAQGNPKPEWYKIIRQKIKTTIPIIPANLMPTAKLENYYILWEVKDWHEIIPPKGDPFLLKRISSNLFSVLAEWDVTEIERAVLRGHQKT